MLKTLHIKNLILIDHCSIDLDAGFTVLTGESGSGKSAFFQGIKLLLGQKWDPALLRSNESKGFVRAEVIEVPDILFLLLDEQGIELEEDVLFLHREFSADGKSKCLIQDRIVSLATLQKVSSYLFQMVDQSAHQLLRQTSWQREFVDRFGSLQEMRNRFAERFHTYQEKQKQGQHLKEVAKQKEREEAFYISQQLELQEFLLSEEEEEALFQEYSLHSRSQEVLTKTEQLFALLSGPSSAQSKMAQGKALCKTLSSLHTLFAEAETLLHNAQTSLEETQHLLRQALSLFDVHAGRFAFLEKTLQEAATLKKKYGASAQERRDYLQQIEEKLQLFATLQDQQESLDQELLDLEIELKDLGLALSEEREKASKQLSMHFQKQLVDLHMEHALVHIQVERQPRSPSGEDKIIFFLAANPGEAMVAVHERSSGGELSRLMLASTLCLAEKNYVPTLIFDEIDANVGGQTARRIGEKLQDLATHLQVLCVTHFPQVARLAHLHLQVQKEHKASRSLTRVHALHEASSREVELLRMLGETTQSTIVDENHTADEGAHTQPLKSS